MCIYAIIAEIRHVFNTFIFFITKLITFVVFFVSETFHLQEKVKCEKITFPLKPMKQIEASTPF